MHRQKLSNHTAKLKAKTQKLRETLLIYFPFYQFWQNNSFIRICSYGLNNSKSVFTLCKNSQRSFRKISHWREAFFCLLFGTKNKSHNSSDHETGIWIDDKSPKHAISRWTSLIDGAIVSWSKEKTRILLSGKKQIFKSYSYY